MSLDDFLEPRRPQNRSGLKDRWRNFLSSPDNRAALVQFGVNMLQPLGAGDSFLSQLGRSAGSAAEAVGRRQAAREEQREANFEREMELAGLGLRQDEIEALRSHRAAELEQGQQRLEQSSRGLDIEQQRADTEAERVARTRGGITQNRLLTERSKAYSTWLKQKTEMNEVPGFEGPDPGPWPAFWDNWKKGVGLEGIVDAGAPSTGDARLTGAGLVAAPAATPPTPPVVGDSRQKTSVNQAWVRNRVQLDRLKEMLESGDATQRTYALQMLEAMKPFVTDPENLTPERFALGGPPVPTQGQ